MNIPAPKHGMLNWADDELTVAQFCRIFRGYLGKEVDILELGSYEGRSARAFLALLGDYAHVTCVDMWQDYDQLPHGLVQKAEKAFDENIQGHAITKIKASTKAALTDLQAAKKRYQIIYVDADHSTEAVLSDARMAWPLLTTGGIMVFDDYLWEFGRFGLTVKVAADTFMQDMYGQYELIERDYRLFLRKV